MYNNMSELTIQLSTIIAENSIEGNLSVRGLAKIAGVDSQSILRSSTQWGSKALAEYLAPRRLVDTSNVAKDGFNGQEVIWVLEYFAYVSTRPSKQSQQIIETLGREQILNLLTIQPDTNTNTNTENNISNLTISTNALTGISAYIDESNGDAYMTDTLICQITGMHNQSLNKIILSNGVHNYASKYAEVLTNGGSQGVLSLRKASDLKVIIRAWKPTTTENIERKEAITDILLDAGAITYVYNLCGYKLQPTPATSTARAISDDEKNFYATLTAQLVQAKADLKANDAVVEAIQEKVDNNIAPVGYKTSEAITAGRYRLHDNISITITSLLKKAGLTWKNDSDANIYYDADEYVRLLEERILNGQFTATKGNKVNSITHVNRASSGASTVASVVSTGATTVKGKRAQVVNIKSGQLGALNKLYASYLERCELEGVKPMTAYSKLNNLVANKLKVSVSTLKIQAGKQSIKQYLIVNHPNELVEVFEFLLSQPEPQNTNAFGFGDPYADIEFA